MPIQNAEIAAVFSEMADLLEVEGVNPFGIRAYRNAARTIGGLGRSVQARLAHRTGRLIGVRCWRARCGDPGAAARPARRA